MGQVQTKARPEVPGPNPGRRPARGVCSEKGGGLQGLRCTIGLETTLAGNPARVDTLSVDAGATMVQCMTADVTTSPLCGRAHVRASVKVVDEPIGLLKLGRQLGRRETWPAETSSFVILFAEQPVLFALMRTTWFESSLATLVPSIERNIVASPDCARFGNADRTV
jgi:hypothetical protein